jgi:hypothetical protein
MRKKTSLPSVNKNNLAVSCGCLPSMSLNGDKKVKTGFFSVVEQNDKNFV